MDIPYDCAQHIDDLSQEAATDHGPAGSVPVRRPGRTYPPLPAPRRIQIDAPPEGDHEPESGQAPAVLGAALAAVSGAGFAVISGDPRYLAVCLLLVLASLGTGRLARRTARRSRQRAYTRRAAAYLVHLDAVHSAAHAAAHHQRDGLQLRSPPAGRMCSALTGTGPDRHDIVGWQRRPEHADFATVRVGTGPEPARVTAELNSSSRFFHGAAESLQAAAQAVVDGTRAVEGCPVTMDLRALRCVAVLGPAPRIRALLRAWLLELALTHAPAELLLVVPRADDAAPGWQQDWGWARWLPHTEAPGAEGSRGLARAQRTVGVSPAAVGPLLRAGPAWSLVVVDGWGVRHPGVVPSSAESVGAAATYVVACTRADDVPAGYDALIRFAADGSCAVLRPDPEGAVVADVLPDGVDLPVAHRTALAIAPWVEDVTGRPANAPRRAASGDRGHRSDGPVALSGLLAEAAELPAMVVPLGRGANGSRVDLDLREPASGGDGPHGVLVGATGSGKSELLRSMVLALAARSVPSDLSFLLVDFKGGATFDALAALPHVAGLVTNLADDRAGVARLQQAVEGELDERQQRLRAAGCESLHRYRERGRPAAASSGQDGSAEMAEMADLLVVVDEFGELLEQQPDLLDTFGRIGRLGRSLGVHLLLSSQRLDEGRLRGLESHLGYRIALRTYTAAESMAVLGSAAAYELPASPGLGLLRTADGLRTFRAATTSAPVPDRLDAHAAEVVRPLVPWTPPAPARRPTGGPAELTTLVRTIQAAAPARARPVCLPALPERIVLAELMRTHPGPGAVLGLVDLAASRRQEPLRVDLDECGHLAVVGSARSGRSTVLRTLAAALAAAHDPSALHLYVLDLAGSLDSLAQMPHTAALAAGHDTDAVRHAVEELAAVVAERLAEPAPRTGHDEADPRCVLLVDDVGRLRREHPEAEDLLAELACTGRAVGVRLALSAARWTDLRPALLDVVGTRLELRLDEPSDSRWPRSRTAAVPSGPGGALSADGAPARMAVADGSEPVATHPAGRRAPSIVPLPRRITEAQIRTAHHDGRADLDADGFLLGVRERRTSPVLLPLLQPGSHLLLLGDRGSGRTTQLLRAAQWVAAGTDEVRLHLVDPRRSLLDLSRLPRVAAHAYDPGSLDRLVSDLESVLQARRPPPGLAAHDLAARSWWSGAAHVLVVDDQDLLPGGDPAGFGLTLGLAPLAGLLPYAADLGWHVLLARPVSGLARAAYDPFLTAARQHATATVVLSGDRAEGPVAGGVAAVASLPGRGRLVLGYGGLPTGELVQCALPNFQADR